MDSETTEDEEEHEERTAVTCGDVLDQLSDFLMALQDKKAYESLPHQQQAAVNKAYYYNRSRVPNDDVPGGRLGNGIRRVDWLGWDTMFGGVEGGSEAARMVNERLGIDMVPEDSDRGRRKGAMPFVFVLNCSRRIGVTEDEREAMEERGRAASGGSR